MGLFFADLVRERSSATGPGDFALAGPLPGHRSFASTVAPGARFHYAIAGVAHPDQWETGEGAIGGDGKLQRDPIASSAAGALVDFSPGLKTVALTVSAAWFAAHDEAEPLGSALNALDELEPVADRLAYFTGADSAALTPLSGFGRTLIGVSGADGARTQLGLGDDASFGGTLHADAAAIGGAVSAGSVSAGTNLKLGAITASGGTAFADLPPLGTATMGLIAHSSGWSGSGFLFTNADTGSKAFSLVCNVDVAFLGFVGASDFAVAATIRENQAQFFSVGLSTDGVSIGGAVVLRARRGGWVGATGADSRASFDTATVTTAQLAQRVKALIDDLTAHGLLGA